MDTRPTFDDIAAKTREWVDLIQKYYAGQKRTDLTQVFMRGPFAGWSERQLASFSDNILENLTKYPINE